MARPKAKVDNHDRLLHRDEHRKPSPRLPAGLRPAPQPAQEGFMNKPWREPIGRNRVLTTRRVPVPSVHSVGSATTRPTPATTQEEGAAGRAAARAHQHLWIFCRYPCGHSPTGGSPQPVAHGRSSTDGRRGRRRRPRSRSRALNRVEGAPWRQAMNRSCEATDRPRGLPRFARLDGGLPVASGFRAPAE